MVHEECLIHLFIVIAEVLLLVRGGKVLLDSPFIP